MESRKIFSRICSHVRQERVTAGIIKHEIYPISRKFNHEIFILEQNLRNHESFLPRKFGAIR